MVHKGVQQARVVVHEIADAAPAQVGDILVDRMKREFKVEANVDAPQVAYSEYLGKPVDVDYTHNFVTTERRVSQLLYDGGFEVERVGRSICVATGLTRDLLAAGALLVNIPGVDALSRYTGTSDLLFRIRKNLFETLTFIARKPSS